MNLRSILRKQRSFLTICFPAIFFSMLTIAMEFVTVMFAGHIDQAHLNGVGLANSLFNVVLSSVIFGYESVFDTYGPQVFASANKKELSTVALRCLAQGALIYLLILGPYLNLVYVIDVLPTAADLLVQRHGVFPNEDQEIILPLQNLTLPALVQEPDLTFKDIAVDYLRLTCTVGYLDYVIAVLSHYLIIQGHGKHCYTITLLMIGSHLLFNYVLVAVYHFGASGLGIAALASRVVTILVSGGICFVLYRRKGLDWSGFTVRVFYNWSPMLKLGLSGTMQEVCEMGLWEIATLLSQFNGPVTLSTVLIQFQIMSVIWSISAGVAYAAAVAVGDSLAEGKKEDVEVNMKITVVNILLESTVFGLLMFLLRGYVIEIFTDEPEVVEMYCGTVWLLCIHIPFDHLQAAFSKGILVAFGKQRFISLSMMVSCYLFGVPTIVLVTFLTNLQISGMFIGFFVFTLTNLAAMAVKVHKLSIDEEIEKSRVRVEESVMEKAANIQHSEDVKTGGLDEETAEKAATIQHSEDVKTGGLDEETNTLQTGGYSESVFYNSIIPDVIVKEDLATEETDKAGHDPLNREVKVVILGFLIATLVFLTSASVSLLR